MADRHAPRMRRAALPVLGGLVAVCMLGATAPGADAGESAAAGSGRPAGPSPAPPAGTTGSAYVQVRFAEDAGVTLAGGQVSAARSADGAALQRELDRAGVGATARLFSQPPSALRADLAHLRAQAPAGEASVPALDQWYRIQTPSPQAAAELADTLAGLDAVDTATVIPAPPPPPATPDLSGLQGYRNPAPDGIGATAVAGIAGATGNRVKVVDIEYSWNLQHEDLPSARGALVPNGTPCDPFVDTNHGTAVLGELVGAPNGFGVTGLVPAAAIATVNAATMVDGSCFWDLANSLNIARGILSPGDVMLLEQQTFGPNAGAYVPVEWDPAVYDAIKAATTAGIIVIEPAGNGGENLNNSTLYGSPFPSGRPSSGAIIVGAGNAPCSGAPRTRIGFSTHGTRVNLQGWGDCVTTTGYGGAFGTTPNTLYTNWFSGTSSASPIVAGAAAALSSVTETRTGTPPTPAQVRQTLLSTGTPQVTGGTALPGNIGPLPNLPAALGGSTATSPSAPTNVAASAASATTATLTWAPPATTGGSPITGYLVARDGGGTSQPPWSKVVPSTARSQSFNSLATGATYQLSVSAINDQGTGPATTVPLLVKVATVPSAPVIGTAQPGTAGGVITARSAWSPPASTGGVPVTGYRVRALRMSGAGAVLGTTTSPVQPASARALSMTLPQTGNYRFTVQAINSVGAGTQSARSNQVAGR